MKPGVADAVAPLECTRLAFLKPKAPLFFIIWSTHSFHVLFAQGMLVLMSIPSMMMFYSVLTQRDNLKIYTIQTFI